MVDAKLEIGEDGADLLIEKNDLALENGLESAVLCSLFSDSRVDPPLSPPDSDDRRGFWADSAADRFGSLLWLHDRSALTTATISAVEEFARAALQWLIADEIAEDVQVTAERLGQETIALEVRILRGTAPRWSRIWEAISGPIETMVDPFKIRILPL